MINLIIAIISILFGGGILAAIVRGVFNYRNKSIEIMASERQQFVRELNDMRDKLSQLYNNQWKLEQENIDLKRKIKELEGHVQTKNDYMRNLQKIVNDYGSDQDVNEFVLKIKKLAENNNVSGN